MGPRRAEAHHAEHDADGHGVEAAEGVPHNGVDKDVVGQDHQPVDTEVHQGQAGAVLAHKVRLVAGVPEEVRIALEALPVEPEARQDAQAEEDHAEGPHHPRMAAAQCRLDLRHSVAQSLIQYRHRKQAQQHAGQGGGVQVVALVDVGGVGRQSGSEEADEHPHRQHQRRAAQGYAPDILAAGIAQQHLAGQGAQGRGEHGQVHILGERFLPHQGIDHNPQEKGPHVQKIDAPEGEPGGEEVSGDGAAPHRRPRQAGHGGAHKAHQRDVKERTGDAADLKVVLG